MNIPNFLSILRIGFIPIIVYSLFNFEIEVSLLFFLFAAGLDLLDGYLARRLNQVTRIGALLDTIGDKLLIFSVVVTLFILNNIHLIFLIIFLFKDIVLIISVIIAKIIHTKKRITFHAKRSGKNVTVLQVLTVVTLILELNISIYLIYLTFIVGIWCLSDYRNEWKKARVV